MAALVFPTSPSIGQTYSANGRSWSWDGTSWVVASGQPAAPSFMGCMAIASATQSIPNATYTLLTDLDSETSPGFDTNNIHSLVTNNSRFTVPAGCAGYWVAKGNVAFAANATGVRLLEWRKNGSRIPGTLVMGGGHANAGFCLQVTAGPLFLTEGDYLELYVYQNSGGALNVGSTPATASDATSGTVYKVDGIVGPTATNPMTTGGDLIYGGASGLPTRLANGSAGQVLTSAGTTVAPTWDTAPSPAFRGARVYRSAALSLNNGSGTAIAFDAELFDSDSLHDNTTNNSRIVLNKIGKWHVGGSIAFQTHATGTRAATLQVNGSLIASATLPGDSGAASGTSVSVSDIVNVTAITDYVELRGYQNSGGALALDVGTAPNYTYLYATYIGP